MRRSHCVIVLDLQMPYDGFQFLKLTRNYVRCKNIPGRGLRIPPGQLGVRNATARGLFSNALRPDRAWSRLSRPASRLIRSENLTTDALKAPPHESEPIGAPKLSGG